ncbi:single-stranded DNA-binding protein [Listeria monocytogenes]|nr:single-stranded DNA-binding protein [Listeria monocytogenes]EAG2584236.1 single-stranded DNA-binding protein [Listeria monocytogenes]
MMNRVVLVGRLTKDPDLRYTPAGAAVATFTLAVNRTFTNQNGEREADFIQCVVWRKPAENVANFLKKGSMAGGVKVIYDFNSSGFAYLESNRDVENNDFDQVSEIKYLERKAELLAFEIEQKKNMDQEE